MIEQQEMDDRAMRNGQSSDERNGRSNDNKWTIERREKWTIEQRELDDRAMTNIPPLTRNAL